jgi:cephalosporin-C deacetylase
MQAVFVFAFGFFEFGRQDEINAIFQATDLSVSLMFTSPFSHSYDFDPAYGMDLAQLLAIAPPVPPEDFSAFWQHRYAAALTVDCSPKIHPTIQTLAGYACFDLSYQSTDGVQIGGWLLMPESGRIRRGVVIGHGYAGRDRPEVLPNLSGAALLFPCFRGLSRSPVAGVSSNALFHVLHNIQDRQRYILGGCVEDLWLGVSALLQLFPQVAGQVSYMGVSFGGGIGALAAPWDARINRLHLHVPTFGDHPLRLTLPCVGSGEAVRKFQRQHNFNVMETLAYYDAASAARHLAIPALVAPALFDPAVPPPGQFAIYNAIPESLRRLYILPAGHFDYPGQPTQCSELKREAADFFMQP